MGLSKPPPTPTSPTQEARSSHVGLAAPASYQVPPICCRSRHMDKSFPDILPRYSKLYSRLVTSAVCFKKKVKCTLFVCRMISRPSECRPTPISFCYVKFGDKYGLLLSDLLGSLWPLSWRESGFFTFSPLGCKHGTGRNGLKYKDKLGKVRGEAISYFPAGHGVPFSNLLLSVRIYPANKEGDNKSHKIAEPILVKIK